MGLTNLITGDISVLILDTSFGSQPDELSMIGAETLVAICVRFLTKVGHLV